jgi:hypothetical protein
MENRFGPSSLDRPLTADDADWDEVSRAAPCPTCGAESGCSRHFEAAFVSCARSPSEWPLTNGTWLHRATLSATTASPAHSEPGRMPPVSQDAARHSLDDHGSVGARTTARTLR